LTPEIELAAAMSPGRVQLNDVADKYAVSNDDGPPCLELLPICHGRCCSLTFALSSQDLDEGVVRWDHGQPYMIRHDADGRCSHQRRADDSCGCYQHRPAPCRSYDCRNDRRIWTDFAARQLAPTLEPDVTDREFRRRAGNTRAVGLLFESMTLRDRR
jgi:Fe-S-cluster containining protein